jgi:queuine tRNA-ribosyltransferase
MINKTFKFEVVYQSTKSRARVGRIHTPHGIIDTPNFVGVGTNGTLKALDNVLLNTIDMQLMFCNTYHLMIQPGADVVEQAGGIHQFINRKQPIITDSGGFQVFSLAYGGVADEIKSKGTKKNASSVLKITEEGVIFRSYKDGTRLLLTPETSIRAQKKIGADIMISFDELPPYHITTDKLRRSFDRTHRWEKRSLDTHLLHPSDQALYAVIHGGINKALRKQSCAILRDQAFDGFAIGGSVGKNRQEMFEMLEFVMPELPIDKPNHLLGIGDLESVPKMVPLGIDTFDSSHPTKAARHGLLFTKQGTFRLNKSGNSTRFQPIEHDCACYTCKHYTLAYLSHLLKAHEPAILTLASIHNVHFMMDMMRRYREAILRGDI